MIGSYLRYWEPNARNSITLPNGQVIRKGDIVEGVPTRTMSLSGYGEEIELVVERFDVSILYTSPSHTNVDLRMLVARSPTSGLMTGTSLFAGYNMRVISQNAK